MNYWFWIAKSDAFIGEEGEEDLYWGDCGEKVEPGDLALIYRRSPYNMPSYDREKYSLIECLVRVKSFPEDDCEISTRKGEPKTGHCCDYEVLHKFENKLKYKEMIFYRDERKTALTDWSALKKNLRGMWHPVDEDSWNKLDELLKEKNEDTYHGFKKVDENCK
ncbi:MAG: hypothetical protein PQ975_09770 [Methanobacterium sp.]|jgi:hypothetical protein